MQTPNKSTKNRLRFVLGVIVTIVMFLAWRLFYLQVYNNEDLKKGALEQWTKGIDIKSNRGVIYDRNGKKLAVNVTAYTVWATPADIENPEETAKTIANILQMEENVVYEKLTKNVSTEKIKQWITREEALELRKSSIRGLTIVDDSKRYYPYGDFASYILGFTDIDNNGLDGIEKTYDKYLSGIPGKIVKTTDAANRQMPYDGEKIYDPENGLSVVLTIDETIQHFAEKAANQALLDNKAKNVSIIVMDPFSGDILALANKPDFDPNEPREPLTDEQKKEWADLPIEELPNKWYDMWRNVAISDVYEPGSTFKVLTAAAALEVGSANLNTHYFCNGFVRDIKGVVLKCASWYNPHGNQTFAEAIANSCNVAFVNMGRSLGKENMYEYIKAFGFGESSGIDLLGEQSGIIPANTDVIKEVNLATMSYGHGIAVTPIQMVNMFSTVANGGNLMKPRLVKQLIDEEGNVLKTFPTEVKRKVLAEKTSETMLKLLEGVVKDGTGRKAYIPGYRVGGKTGTAEKIIDGRYADGKYIASFGAIAPVDDPKIAVLIIIDEPSGVYYGGTIAGPVAKSVIEDTLNYLEVEPKFTEDEKELIEQKIIVPDVRNKKIGDAGKLLTELELRYTTEYQEITTDSTVLDQFPLPGVEVIKGSIIDLYLNEKPNILTMPDLIGKTKDEAIKILDELNLQYTLNGTGKVTNQSPGPGENLSGETNIVIELSDT
ncbi:PASTA domain-containing penicillin-binding protein [Tissierella sp. Yu-01]|uniref:PASTA domain-containing penicillin-binding protein n=1 Tax=Tissierella sp. Yu-01 TaxID=3035694 RepID=UPI00240E0B0D|nr:PASTA domain-containing penicillin-binding protein [Tissierella sp. Yu-01]WFA09627.1 penicillin-binding transpeptidase domain-containing protein [Tissierella sp. Yu-01]